LPDLQHIVVADAHLRSQLTLDLGQELRVVEFFSHGLRELHLDDGPTLEVVGLRYVLPNKHLAEVDAVVRVSRPHPAPRETIPLRLAQPRLAEEDVDLARVLGLVSFAGPGCAHNFNERSLHPLRARLSRQHAVCWALHVAPGAPRLQVHLRLLGFGFHRPERCVLVLLRPLLQQG
jgi:hypothetical protein